ncbi:hypothetical protein Tco_0504460, partial [Tanacetum coccineum]
YGGMKKVMTRVAVRCAGCGVAKMAGTRPEVVVGAG